MTLIEKVVDKLEQEHWRYVSKNVRDEDRPTEQQVRYMAHEKIAGMSNMELLERISEALEYDPADFT